MGMLVITPWKTNVISFLRWGRVGGKSKAYSKHLWWGSYNIPSFCFVVLFFFLLPIPLYHLPYLMSLFSHGCSSLHPSLTLFHPMHRIQTLDWPYCLPKAHLPKPRSVLLAPQPAKSTCSLAFTCLWAVISASWMPQPTVCTKLSVTLTWLSHNACWGFQTARKPATSSSEKKCQPGSRMLETTHGKEKSQSRAQGWMTLKSELQNCSYAYPAGTSCLPWGAITLLCLLGLINLDLPRHQSAKWLFEHWSLAITALYYGEVPRCYLPDGNIMQIGLHHLWMNQHWDWLTKHQWCR